MRELAALRRAQSVLAPRPGLGPEAEGGHRAERAVALRLEQRRAPAQRRSRRHRRRARVVARIQVRAGGEHRGRRARRRCRRRRAGPRGDERRRDARVVVDALRMAEDDLGRRARKEIGDQTRVVQLARGRRPRHPALALPGERQQRVRSRGRRPRLGAETGDPEGIERQSGRLEQPEDPDRRRRRFRLEHRLGRESGEQRQRFPSRQPAGHHFEPGQRCQQVVPGPERLVLGAAPGSIAGPADGGQQRAPVVAPGARRRAAAQPRPRQCRAAALRERGVDGFEAAGERAGVDRFAAGLPPIVSPRPRGAATPHRRRAETASARAARPARGTATRRRGRGGPAPRPRRARRPARRRATGRRDAAPRAGRATAAPGKGCRRPAPQPRRAARRGRRSRRRRSTPVRRRCASAPSAAPRRSRPVPWGSRRRRPCPPPARPGRSRRRRSRLRAAPHTLAAAAG